MKNHERLAIESALYDTPIEKGSHEMLTAFRQDEEELSALRARVVELEAALTDTLALAWLKWGNLDPDVNTVFENARAVLAKKG